MLVAEHMAPAKGDRRHTPKPQRRPSPPVQPAPALPSNAALPLRAPGKSGALGCNTGIKEGHPFSTEIQGWTGVRFYYYSAKTVPLLALRTNSSGKVCGLHSTLAFGRWSCRSCGVGVGGVGSGLLVVVHNPYPSLAHGEARRMGCPSFPAEPYS